MKKDRINLIGFLMLLVFFPQIKPGYFNEIPFMSEVYLLGKIIALLVLLFVFFHKNKLSKLIIFFMLYRFTLLLSTLVNMGDIISWFTGTIYSLIIILSIEIFLDFNKTTMLNVFSFVFEILIYINLISMLLYPEGLYYREFGKAFFLGGTNVAARYIIPGLILTLIRSEVSKSSIDIRAKLLIVCSVLSIYLSQSMTGLIGMLPFLFFVIPFSYFNKIISKLNLSYIYIASIIFFLLIVIIEVENIIPENVLSYLGKDITFTGRTYLWENAKYYITQNWFLGYGIENSDKILSKIGNKNGAHNFYLDLLYRGGVLSFSIFSLCINRLNQRVKKIKNIQLKNIFIVSFISYVIMWQFEPFYNEEYLMMILVSLAFYSDKLQKHQLYFEYSSK